MLIGLAALAAAAWFAYQQWIAPRPLPEGLVQANGRIEGDDVLVAAKFRGRVAELAAAEGDHVRKDQVMARLDDTQTSQRVQEARKSLQRLQAEANALQEELALLQRRVPLDIERAQKALQAAQAELERSRALRDQAGREARRFAELLERDTVAKQAAERYATEFATAQKLVEAAQATLQRRQKALEQAKLGRQRIQAKTKQVQAARAAAQKAQAALQRATATLEDLTIRAPASGMVVERVADLGEVVPQGGVLFEIVDLDSLYLKAYVPETHTVQLAPGQPARIFADAYPEEFAPATLRYVASEAEFTPREVQTAEQRTDLVYAVKLYLQANPGHRLTPGLPADAVIKVDANAPWAEPRQ